MSFADHFSRQADSYALFRPTYPAALFEALSAAAPGHRAAWDCGTGNGQAAVALAAHFREVWATDPSAAQLAHAVPHPRVSYRQVTAEASGLPDASVDLITVANALHWFHHAEFYREAARVLVPGGLLAAWCYPGVTLAPEIDAEIHAFYSRTLAGFWPAGRAWVEEGYRTLDFPFEEIALPPFEIVRPLTLAELAGFLGTWSATERYKTAHGGEDPVLPVIARIAVLWGPPDTPRPARWPLAVRAGYRRG